MPRSKDPANYGTFYWQLVDYCHPDQKEIRIAMPLRKASHVRYQIYAFINALEREAEKLRKNKDLDGASLNLTRAKALRKFIVQVHIMGKPVRHIHPNTADMQAELVLTNRDRSDDVEDWLAQLEAQIDRTHSIPVEVNLAAPKPPVNIMDIMGFNKPLKVNPNADEIDPSQLASYPRSDNTEEQQGDGNSDIQQPGVRDSNNSDSNKN